MCEIWELNSQYNVLIKQSPNEVIYASASKHTDLSVFYTELR